MTASAPRSIGEAVKVLDAVLPGVEKTEYDLGARRYHATGEVLPDSVLDELREPRRDPARRHRRPVGAQRRAGTRTAAADPVRARPPRQPAARRGCIPGVSSPLGRQSRHRLRRRPRGHRGPVHRQRRRDPRRHPARDRHRGQRQHRVRRATRRARRVPSVPSSAAST